MIRQWQTVIQKFPLRGFTGWLLYTVTAPPCDAQLDHGVSPFRALVLFSESNGAQRPFTFEDYFNNNIRWKSYNLYWISGMPVEQLWRVRAPVVRLPVTLHFTFADREYLHKVRDGNVILHNAETREESLYLSNSTFVRYI